MEMFPISVIHFLLGYTGVFLVAGGFCVLMLLAIGLALTLILFSIQFMYSEMAGLFLAFTSQMA